MEDIEIRLPSKPTAPLQASLYLPPTPSSTLIVFLNGLILPRTAWSETIDHLLFSSGQQDPFPHAILTYDRFGQGTSPSDPADPPSTPYGHDALTIIADLHSLLTEVIHTRICQSPPHLNLILVCSSIGCPLSRLYASAYHSEHEIAGYIFLDSMMANTDFVSLFPDPSSPDFDPSQLPEGITPSDVEHARSRFRDIFHPDVGNPERFDRRRLREQLPFPDEPKLPTLAARNGEEDETEPWLVVVGHDPETFAEQCEKVNGALSVSKTLINAYVNPSWKSYNEGLASLVRTSYELKVAHGCGHFIQKDDPAFVATEITRLLDRASNR